MASMALRLGAWTQSLPEETRRLIALAFLAIAGIALFSVFIVRTRSSVSSLALTPAPQKETSDSVYPEELKTQDRQFLSPLEGIAESLKNAAKEARNAPRALATLQNQNAKNGFFSWMEKTFAFIAAATDAAAEMFYGALGREITP